MTEIDLAWVVREVKTGIVTVLLFGLTASLGRYVYLNRVTLTVEERDARDAAIGLTVVFGALFLRSSHLWALYIAERNGWNLPIVESPPLYLTILAMLMMGAILVLRSFQPWPVWAAITAAAIAIPIAAALL